MSRAWVRPLQAAIAAAVVLPAAPGAALAQPAGPRLEVSAGALFVGGYSLASTDANLVANQAGGPAYTFFKSDTKVDGALGVELRAGVRLSPMFTVEGGVLTTRPRMTTRLSGDVENAPDTTASEDLSVYIIDAALVANVGSGQDSRVRPFVRVGAGYVRELHNDNLLVETGTAYHAGGGVTVWLSQNKRRFGVRADARVYVINGGINFDSGNRTSGAGGAALVFAF